jgi:multidrug efflux pump subunit AcrA (membrane-fusion protein)
MTVEPAILLPPTDGATHRVPRRSIPLWRRRRLQLLVLALTLVVAVALVLARSQPQSSTQVAAPAAAPLVAHGQILPARQARVGTQTGGVVQRLDVSPGDQVAAQTPLALVTSAAGSELVTAPFDGTVTNVLVHAGDTLVPGSAIAVVADLHVLQVETSDVDEFLVSKVSVGQRVQLTIDALDNRLFAGTVSNVALLPQNGSNGTAAYPVISRVGGLPRAGMSVRVTFPD